MQSKNHMKYLAISAQQSSEHKVLTFKANASDVLRFASIDRISRDRQGELSGFQRPQVAVHIREIKDYLEKPNSILPNPIVVAFIDHVSVEEQENGTAVLEIDIASGPPGFIVDGQQRLTALSEMERDFEVFVSVMICKDEQELCRQFVLINNTKPLPKSLIYELLPTIDGLPPRLSKRSTAAELTARLNFEDTSLKGYIKQHTSPDGIIADTIVQKILMTSLSDGILRDMIALPKGSELCVNIVSEFFEGVKRVFPDAWWGHTPKTSRLLHGAGLQALGDVMELLAFRMGARSASDFASGMACLVGNTAWTEGEWNLNGETRTWNSLQNVNRDVAVLKHHLVSVVKNDIRRQAKAMPAPLLEPIESCA